ncbi:hypothetical protein ACEN3U_04895 [Weissella hellenica]
MNLYKISQDVNDDWDTFDSAVVVAESAEEAKKIIPDHHGGYRENPDYEISIYDWAKPEDVKVEFIGLADKAYLDSLDGRQLSLATTQAKGAVI